MNIYEISNEVRSLYEKLNSGEVVDVETGEISPVFLNQLMIKKDELATKSVDYGYVIKSFDNELSIYDNEIKRLQDRRKQIEKVRNKMEDVVSSAMQEFGITDVKGKTIELNFRKSEQVDIYDESLIEDKFKKIQTEISKTKIKNALKNGEDVQGAKLVTKQNLQIR